MQKFKCMDCGSEFSIEARGEVKCPSCHSDNVAAEGGKRPIWQIVAVGALGLVVVGLAVVLLTRKPADTTEPASEPDGPNVPEFVDFKITEPPTVVDGKYNFGVKAQLSQSGDYALVYSLTTKSTEGADSVVSSTDGTFTGIPATVSGSYLVTVVAENAPEVEADNLLISGFDAIAPDAPSEPEKPDAKEDKPVPGRYSVQEVQHWFNTLASDGSSSKLFSTKDGTISTSGVRYTFRNLRAGDPKPSNASDIQAKFSFGDWDGVTVNAVGYDSKGAINSIDLSIKYPD